MLVKSNAQLNVTTVSESNQNTVGPIPSDELMPVKSTDVLHATSANDDVSTADTGSEGMVSAKSSVAIYHDVDSGRDNEDDVQLS